MNRLEIPTVEAVLRYVRWVRIAEHGPEVAAAVRDSTILNVPRPMPGHVRALISIGNRPEPRERWLKMLRRIDTVEDLRTWGEEETARYVAVSRPFKVDSPIAARYAAALSDQIRVLSEILGCFRPRMRILMAPEIRALHHALYQPAESGIPLDLTVEEWQQLPSLLAETDWRYVPRGVEGEQKLMLSLHLVDHFAGGWIHFDSETRALMDTWVDRWGANLPEVARDILLPSWPVRSGTARS